MKHTITLSQINPSYCYSVKDNSPRGCHTASFDDLKIGDKIVIDNYFHEIIEEPTEAHTETPTDTKASQLETVIKLYVSIEARKDRSAWNKGINEYCFEFIGTMEEAVSRGWLDIDTLDSKQSFEKWLLNGACSWQQYSEGGCSLIYDEDIAKRLCTPSELKRTRNGENPPNSFEDWLDVQTRALYQACNRLYRIFKPMREGKE